MKHFIQTSEAEGHYHVVYQNDDAKVAAASTSKIDGHTHDVVWVQPPPQVDPATGQPVGEPQPGYWQVGPSPLDGHTHELMELELEDPKVSTEEDSEVVADVHRLFGIAADGESKSYKNAEESAKFYKGEQWDVTLKQKLEAMARAAVTLNFIEKNVDDLNGYQIEQRTEIRYLPVEGGDQRVADLFTFLAKYVSERCFYQREKSKVFIDQIVVGRGLFNLWVDYTKNVQGEVVIERFPWRGAVFGPHEKEDASDAEYVCKHKMYSVGKLKQLYPEKADEISQAFSCFAERDEGHVTHASAADAYKSPSTFPFMTGEFSNVDIAKKELRLVEVQRRIFQRSNVVAQVDDDLYVRADNWPKASADMAKTIPGVQVFEAPVTRIRITRVVGPTLLEDLNPAELPTDDFFIVPAYGKFCDGEYWGKVERAKDAQREINKRHSQAIDIGNKCAAYGFYYSADTFPNDEALEQFKRQSSSPGFIQEINDSSRPPTQVEGVKFPAEIVNLMQVSKDDLRELMNIEVVPGGANDSGDKLLTMEKQKMRGNNWLFDNLAFSEKQVGRLLFHLIQKIYPPARVARLINSLTPDQAQAQQVGEKDLSQYTPEEIYEIMSNVEAEQYDVQVSDGTYTPTVQLANFLLLRDEAGKGMPVPPDVLVELMPLPADQKQKIIQSIQMQQQAQADEQKISANAEIDKTLIAHGMITPRIAEQAGIPPNVGVSQPQPNGAPLQTGQSLQQ